MKFSSSSLQYNISVWLAENQSSDLEIFYCCRCTYPLLEYKGDIVSIIPGTSKSKLPMIVKCKGKLLGKGWGGKCNTKYCFHLVVKKEI